MPRSPIPAPPWSALHRPPATAWWLTPETWRGRESTSTSFSRAYCTPSLTDDCCWSPLSAARHQLSVHVTSKYTDPGEHLVASSA